MKKIRISTPIFLGLSLLFAGIFGAGFLALYRHLDGSVQPLKELSESVLIRGNTIFLNRADPGVSETIGRLGVWEPMETEVILNNLNEGDVFIDAGANIGYYTVLAAQAVGTSGKVYAFDPDPVSIGLLGKSVKANRFSNVVVEQKALSDKPGMLNLYLDDVNLGDHRIYQPGKRPSIKVEAVSVDGYLKSDQKVDLIKMDTQGAEVLILRGMRETLKRNRNVKLVLEYWPKGYKECGQSAEECLRILKEEGFRYQEVREGSMTVADTTEEELLRKYTPANGLFTNLLCRR